MASVANPIKLSLHVFSDASVSAYAGAIYLRSVDKLNNVQCHLIMALKRHFVAKNGKRLPSFFVRAIPVRPKKPVIHKIRSLRFEILNLFTQQNLDISAN